MMRMPPSRATAASLVLVLAVVSACADQEGDAAPGASAVVAGGTAAGAIPTGLPARELVGLFEDTGATWMKSRRVPWDVRYRYFNKGWVNNLGFGETVGLLGR